MVGPRLNTWFEKAPPSVWTPKDAGLEIVALSLEESPMENIRQALEKISLEQ